MSDATAPEPAPAPEGPPITVTVRWFAVLREHRGCDEESVTVPAGTTAAGLYARLVPAGSDGRMPVMYAVDHAYVPGRTALEDGVEVAFIPPLGGG